MSPSPAGKVSRLIPEFSTLGVRSDGNEMLAEVAVALTSMLEKTRPISELQAFDRSNCGGIGSLVVLNNDYHRI